MKKLRERRVKKIVFSDVTRLHFYLKNTRTLGAGQDITSINNMRFEITLLSMVHP